MIIERSRLAILEHSEGGRKSTEDPEGEDENSHHVSDGQKGRRNREPFTGPSPGQKLLLNQGDCDGANPGRIVDRSPQRFWKSRNRDCSATGAPFLFGLM